MDPTLIPPPAEPCPTPLAWAEVVQAFCDGGQVSVVDVPGGEIQAIEFGNGPPLVFAPLLSGSPLLFALTAWLLKDDFRCVLLDHPHWKSAPSFQDLIPRTADACGLAIQALHPDGASLYASGWGGQTALQLMAASPELVQRAILQGAWAHRSFSLSERTLLHVGRRVSRPVSRLPLWLRTQLQNHRRWFPPFDETRFGFLLQETCAVPTNLLAERFLAAAATDLRPHLSSIETPTLVLRCEGDGAAIASTQSELEQRLPGASCETMALTGHYPFLTHPHRLVKFLKAFLLEPVKSNV